MTAKKKRYKRGLSLSPLGVDEAIADLLRVKPSPKPKEATRKKPKKK